MVKLPLNPLLELIIHSFQRTPPEKIKKTLKKFNPEKLRKLEHIGKTLEGLAKEVNEDRQKTSSHKDKRLSRYFFVLCLNASEVALSPSETLKDNNASFLLGRAIGFWIGTQDEWQQVSHRLGCRRLSKADLKDLDDAVQILVSYELPFRMQPGPSKGSIITSLKNHKDELQSMGTPLEFNHNIPLSKKGFRRA